MPSAPSPIISVHPDVMGSCLFLLARAFPCECCSITSRLATRSLNFSKAIRLSRALTLWLFWRPPQVVWLLTLRENSAG